MKYSSSPNSMAFSLGTKRSLPLYFSISLILLMSLNLSITRFLKYLTPSIFKFKYSLPVSKITCSKTSNRLGSSVVGKTLTSPLIPWVVVITPTLR